MLTCSRSNVEPFRHKDGRASFFKSCEQKKETKIWHYAHFPVYLQTKTVRMNTKKEYDLLIVGAGIYGATAED